MTDQPKPPSESFVELSQFALHRESIRLLARAFCHRNLVVVLGEATRDDQPVAVGMLDPDDRSLLDSIAWMLGRPIRPVQLNAYEIRKALEAGWGDDEPDLELRLSLRPVSRLTFAPEHPIPEVLNEVLARAVALGASDVHIEAHDDDVDLRYRVDGVLRQITSPIGMGALRQVMARLKVLGGLDIAETRAAQEGRILATYETESGRRPIDFRISIIPGPFGEDAVLRVLDGTRQIVALTSLGFSDAQRELLTELIGSPEGLVLATGPTGSGKTTTIYSLLHVITGPEVKVLTVEDPIEYRFPKINQKQITSRLGFAEYARAFLRQDPDVIMIGEIRDEHTADVAIRAAQTGHLVLSTLHTNDALGAVRRLETLGVRSENVAETLLCVLAQRLVRKICASCREPTEPDPADARLFAKVVRTGASYRGRGCERCRGTGYTGRAGIFELLAVDDALAEGIARGDTLQSLRKHARTHGMTLLLEDGAAKVEAGVTTYAELRNAISYRLIHDYEEATGYRLMK